MLRSITLIGVLCLFAISSTSAAYCNGKPDPNAKPNMNPIIVEKPVFVKQIKNAKLYTLAYGDDQIYITHLWGTPYEMGFAHGTLVKDRMIGLVNTFWNYMESQIINEVNKTTQGFFRPDFLKDVSDFGLDVALDIEFAMTNKFTGKYFNEQIQGMADATGLEIKKIRRIHLIGELTKGQCSMFGAWGKALADPSNLLQLRGLDWVTEGGLQDFPEITVYHPTKGANNGHDFANIGWTGWIGSIIGYSSTRLGISEIGVYFSDETYGKESRFGVPFTYLLRDILQFDDTILDANKRIATANRTCDLILGVGDGKSKKFNSVQYSYSVANFMNDTNMKPVADWHPPIPNTIYYGKDWNCPGFNVVMSKQLQTLYGNLTAEAAIRYVTAITQTGSLATVYYDYGTENVYIANARGTNETGPEMAYDRPFVKVYMPDLFAEQPPPTFLD